MIRLLKKIFKRIELNVVLLISIVFIGTLFRFINLGQKSLWFDEAILRYESNFPYHIMIKMNNSFDSFPFVFIILVKLMGYFASSEFALRFIPFLFSLGSIILMYFLCREFLEKLPSCIGTLLVSLSTLQITESQELRPYSMLMFLSIALLISFIKYFKHRKNVYLLIYLIVSTVSIFSHYASYLFLFSFNLIICAQIIKNKISKKDIKKWFIVQGFLILSLVLVWNINLKYQLEMQRNNPASHAHITAGFPKSKGIHDIIFFLINNTKEICGGFYGKSNFDTFMLLLLFVIGVIYIHRDRQKRLIIYMFLSLVFINISLAILRFYPYFWGKYAIYLSPYYYFFIASAFNVPYLKNRIFIKMLPYLFIILYLVNIEVYNDFKYLFSPGREES